MIEKKILLRIIGFCFFIYGIVQLKSILKDRKKTNFAYENRYDINVIAISLMLGIGTL